MKGMTTRPFSRFNFWVMLFFAAAFAIWTHLSLNSQVLGLIDASSDTPRLVRDSPAAQIWAAFAIVTEPLVIWVALLALGWWAWRRRLRHLGVAVVAASTFSWIVSGILKVTVQRPRPDSPLADAITYSGWSYPSMHITMATTATLLVIAVTTTTRQPRSSLLAWRVIGFIFIIAVGYDRWVMNAHRITDIVGGLLLGGVIISTVFFFARVRMVPLIAARQRTIAKPLGGLCAVIYNPIKVADEMVFRRQVANELSGNNWETPLWLPTSPDDAGHQMAQEAITRGADLVICAGGDGTVRVVTEELAGTEIPVGLVPSGTGNLLAKNLGIPLDQEDAIKLAFRGQPAAIDLIKLVVDHDEEHPLRFSVMAGIGFDARLMERTNNTLKRMMGSAAYALSAMPELFTKPHRVEIGVDGVRQVRRNAVLTVMGNVASIGAGIELIPEAHPADGRMEMVVGSPTGLSAWARMAAQVLTKIGADRSLEQYAGTRISVKVDEPMPYELDGDTVGEGSYFEAEVDPSALTILLPPNEATQLAAAR